MTKDFKELVFWAGVLLAFVGVFKGFNFAVGAVVSGTSALGIALILISKFMK